MKNIPKKIYLQIGDCDCEDWNEIYPSSEITWCVDNIFETDIEYIRIEKKKFSQIKETICLLHSMVLSGEKTDGTATKMAEQSLENLKELSDD